MHSRQRTTTNFVCARRQKFTIFDLNEREYGRACFVYLNNLKSNIFYEVRFKRKEKENKTESV